MKVTELRLGCSHTVGLPNYSSIKVEASLVVAVEEGETLADVSARAQVELRRVLEETYRAQRRKEGTLDV